MSRNILVLAGSARKHGNTDRLADEFIRGAREAGHQAEKIYLKDYKINGCLGCGACQRNGGTCMQKDDMTEIYGKWLAADAVALASPVYFYTWNSQMKAALDRTFAIEQKVKDTTFYLLSAGSAPGEDYMCLMLESFRKYVACFRAGGNTEGGYVFGLNTNAPGDVDASDAAAKVYELGKAL